MASMLPNPRSVLILATVSGTVGNSFFLDSFQDASLLPPTCCSLVSFGDSFLPLGGLELMTRGVSVHHSSFQGSSGPSQTPFPCKHLLEDPSVYISSPIPGFPCWPISGWGTGVHTRLPPGVPGRIPAAGHFGAPTAAVATVRIVCHSPVCTGGSSVFLSILSMSFPGSRGMVHVHRVVQGHSQSCAHLQKSTHTLIISAGMVPLESLQNIPL